jgi:hypothetical protein
MMVNDGQNWSNMTKHGRTWSNMVKHVHIDLRSRVVCSFASMMHVVMCLQDEDAAAAV